MTEIDKCIIVLAGLPLSGKTTVGEALSAETGIAFYDIDQTRQEIMPGHQWLGPEKEKAIMLEAYERNHQKAEEELKRDKSGLKAVTRRAPIQI